MNTVLFNSLCFVFLTILEFTSKQQTLSQLIFLLLSHHLGTEICSIQEISDVSGVCNFQLAAQQQQQLYR